MVLARALFNSVGVTLCAGLLGCQMFDKPKDQPISKPVSATGLPGTPMLPSGTGAGANRGYTQNGMPSGSMGSMGMQGSNGAGMGGGSMSTNGMGGIPASGAYRGTGVTGAGSTGMPGSMGGGLPTSYPTSMGSPVGGPGGGYPPTPSVGLNDPVPPPPPTYGAGR
jgi:hypothetical protein